MPEIKHNFTGGKMNKDLDERLVPQGEYRDAMNIQVSTSDEGDVGTIQNILGNSQGCSNINLPHTAKTISSISDEKNDTLYWLVSGQEFSDVYSVANTSFTWASSANFSDFIIQKTNSGCELVFVDNYGFTAENNEDQPIDSLTLPYFLMQQIEVGMTVTGVGNNVSPTNTVVIEKVLKNPIADFSIGYDAGNILGQAPIAGGIYVGLLETSFAGQTTLSFIQTNDIFITTSDWATLNLPISNAIPNATTGYPGAEFEIPGLTQPNTYITSATAVSLSYTNGLGQDMIKITLSQPLNSPAQNQPPWTASSVTIGMTGGGGSNALATFYPTINNGNPFNAAVSWSTYSTTAFVNGNIVFNPSYLSFLQGLTVGDEVVPNLLQFPETDAQGNPVQYYVGSIDLNNLSITVIDGNDDLVFPLTYWGNTGSIQVVTSNSGTIFFDNTLNLSGFSEFLFFQRERVLNFNHNNLITGINIVDDMLFWTDGFTEPKKINIKNSIEGTTNVITHTVLVNPEQYIDANSGIDVREKHVTVIRKAPKKALTVITETNDSFAFGTTLDTHSFLVNPLNAVQGNLIEEDTVNIFFLIDPLSPNSLNNNDIVLFNQSSSTSLPNEDYQVQVILQSQINDGSSDLVFTPASFSNFLNIPISFPANTLIASAGEYEIWSVKIVKISTLTPTDSQEYNWAVKTAEKQKFKNKFPRYSYRYKYIDGEYSTFAPFTNIIFEPKDFKYDVKECYNIGMENQISKTILTDYNINMPKDVVEIDLLYKESNSPVVYTIDTIRKNNLIIQSSYEIKPSQIRAVLPENQLLRPWDNVPRNALAQEVTGNRIVYGNYLQNYTMSSEYSFVNAVLVNRSSCDVNSRYKSLKSIRNYSFGISYLDRYGRQTPVFTNKSADVEIPIEKSSLTNQVSTNIVGDIPEWATHYKIFVKETSNEYYNLAMDRLYNAEDGNVWLSFPSSDRNKVDEETFLILKKGVEGSDPVKESNKYKIIAIENEAPDFVKTKLSKIGEVAEDGTTPFAGDIFPNSNDYPIKGEKKVVINKTNFDAIGLPLDDILEIQVRFTTKIGSLTQQTGAYDVVNFNVNDDNDRYTLVLDRPIEEEWTTDDGTTPTLTAGIIVFEKQIINSPQFDGRFFVKVSRDININNYIVKQATDSLVTAYEVVDQIPFNYIADANNPEVSGNTGALTTNQPSPNDKVGGQTDKWYDWAAIYGANAMKNSGWFIDAAYYAGTYPDAQFLQENGMAPPTEPIDVSFLGHTRIYYDIHNEHPETATSGFNKGIWTDPVDNQTYIYLSFGQIQSSAPNASTWQQNDFELHTSADDGDDQLELAVDECMEGTIFGTDYFNLLNGSGFENGCTDYNDNLNAGLQAFHEGLFDWNDDNDHIKHWKLGSQTLNPAHADEKTRVTRLQQGQKFKFAGDTNNTLYTITGTPQIKYHLSHSDTKFLEDRRLFARQERQNGNFTSDEAMESLFDAMNEFGHSRNRRITYKIPIDKDPTDPSLSYNPVASSVTVNTLGTIQFVDELFVNVNDQIVSEDPAIWETEPKEDIGLNIYYELDSVFPLEINNNTNLSFAPIGSEVSINVLGAIPSNTTVVGWSGNIVQLSNSISNTNVSNTETITFSRLDGSCVRAKWLGLAPPLVDDGSGNITSIFLEIDPNVSRELVSLAYFNCYSFLNGVESNRIRDDFNQVVIDKGAKASSTLEEPYKEEHRKYGLIYSGLYNSNSGVNNLNQFIQAEKITKDINPTYGSIQKLYSRSTADGDLIALCEDRVLKILANKDAVFNADGKAQLTATENVLGQTMPYSGDYGISKNPESFASESYRVYFTDKIRGAVIRLSKDGLTPISDYGMKDWFRDNLKLSNKLIGSYDDRKSEYNITLDNSVDNVPKTVSFKENVKGWVSFKSFTPENAISCANEYYSFQQGVLWKHHDSLANRNTFYSLGQYEEEGFTPSSFIVVLNQLPSIIKSFKTINYEGSQAKVTQTLDDNGNIVEDGQYFNLDNIKGWYVNNLTTNLEQGGVTDFINKEGKWFGHVVGSELSINNSGISISARTASAYTTSTNSFDANDSSTGGIGLLNSLNITTYYGCTDPSAINYDSSAKVDDGSCIAPIYGCTDPAATNYSPTANYDNGTCNIPGCTDPSAFNYDPNANIDNGSCTPMIVGCTIVGNFNYDPNANTPCSGQNPVVNNNNIPVSPSAPNNYCCEPFIYGCMDANAYNYDKFANTTDPNNLCFYVGCTDLTATNFDFNENLPTYQTCVDVDCYLTQTGANCCCEYPPNYGCIDEFAYNYDQSADTDDGSCIYQGCSDPSNPSTENYRLESQQPACNATVFNFNGNSYNATVDDGSCIYCNKPDIAGAPVPVVDFATQSVTLYWIEKSEGLSNDSKFQLQWKEAASNTQWSNTVNIVAGTSGATCDNGNGGYNANWSYTMSTGDQGKTYRWRIKQLDCDTSCDSTLALPVSSHTWTEPYPGCTDSSAFNYDANATYDDGSCIAVVNGCTDPTAFNYDSLANTDDSSCVPVIIGCTDPTAFNYNAAANTDNGSCTPFVYGCLDDVQAIVGSDRVYAATNYLGDNNDLNYPVANTPCDGANLGCDNTSGNECTGAVGANNGCCTFTIPSINIVKQNQNYIEFRYNNKNTVYLPDHPNGFPEHVVAQIEYYDIDASGTETLIKNYGNVNASPAVTAGGFTSNIVSSNNIIGGIRVQNNNDVDNLLSNNRTEVKTVMTLLVGPSSSLNHPTTGNGPFDSIIPMSKTWTVGCNNPAADNYGPYDIADNDQCQFIGCMDATPAHNSPNGYAASNYDPIANTPCTSNHVGSPYNDGSTPLDNSCCTYYDTGTDLPEKLYNKVTLIQGSSNTPNDKIRIAAFRDNTGFTDWSIAQIQINTNAFGNTSNPHSSNYNNQASNYDTSINYVQLDAVSGNTVTNPNVTGLDVPLNWVDYVDNNQVTISVLSIWEGTVDNDSLSTGLSSNAHQLPFMSSSNILKKNNVVQTPAVASVTYTAGCRTAELGNGIDYVNLDNNLDLHIPGSCAQAYSGCMDPTTKANNPTMTNTDISNYSTLHNKDCNGNVQLNANLKFSLEPGNSTTGVNYASKIVTLSPNQESTIATSTSINIGDRFISEAGNTYGGGENAYTGYTGNSAFAPNIVEVVALGGMLSSDGTTTLNAVQVEVSEIITLGNNVSDGYFTPHPTPTYDTGCCCYGADFTPLPSPVKSNNAPGAVTYGVQLGANETFESVSWINHPVNGTTGTVNTAVRIAIQTPPELMGGTSIKARIDYRAQGGTFYQFNYGETDPNVYSYTHADFPGYLLYDCPLPQYPSSTFNPLNGGSGGWEHEVIYEFRVKIHVDSCGYKSFYSPIFAEQAINPSIP